MSSKLAKAKKEVSVKQNSVLLSPSRPCNASHITFGNRCLNCGGVNGHANQPQAVR